MKARKTGRLGFLVAAILTLAMVSLPGNAAAKDRNNDRIPDRWEKQNKLSLKKDQRKLDQDRDGLRNRAEWRAGTDPRDRDSDDDGTPDGEENVGFIAAYGAEAGRLQITLYGGGSIEGRVGERTKIRCKRASTEKVGDESRASGEESEDVDHVPGRHHRRRACSLSDLAEGVVVNEADVKYKSNGVFFKRLVIVKSAAAS